MPRRWAVDHPVVMTPATALAVREARPDELPAVNAVLRAAFAEHAAAIPGELFHAYLEDLTRVGSGADLLVVTVDEQVVATARLYLDASIAALGLPADWSLVRAVGVDPRRRGAGLATALMDACAERAARAGARALALHTADFMASAVRLYARLGYHPAPRYDFVPGGQDATAGDPVVVRAYTLQLVGPAGRSGQPDG